MKDNNSDLKSLDEVEDLQWTADQEILLLYSLHGYKPVGIHKHARMLVIQDRFSSSLSKNVSCRAIWKKLNTLYDLEALDEAETEADATVAVETDFSLPEDELGEMMRAKISGRPFRVDKLDLDSSYSQQEEMITEIKTEPPFYDEENEFSDSKETLETLKAAALIKDGKKEHLKKGPKKKDLTPTKDSNQVKKEITKETPKKDVPGKRETVKKGGYGTRDEEKKDLGKKSTPENKKDNPKEEKKEFVSKLKRDSADKRVIEQTKKDTESKKPDQKKAVDVQKTQRVEPSKARSETPKQLRTESTKRTEVKSLRSETPKLQKTESTPKAQRAEVLKKESSADKKKEVTDKKGESKSEKTVESRGAKLRTRGREFESEKPETPTDCWFLGTKRERSKDSISKTSETQTEEPPAKKSKTTAPKGRPTRNSIEPQPKPASPTVTPTKRRTRLL